MSLDRLERLPVPRQCGVGAHVRDGEHQCRQQAYWAFDGCPLCHEDLINMAVISSDNEKALWPALIAPVVLQGRGKGELPLLLVYGSTCLASIICTIDMLPEAGFRISMRDDRDNEIGWGRYRRCERIDGCHAPLIGGEDYGKLTGFLRHMDLYVHEIRRRFRAEFQEDICNS